MLLIKNFRTFDLAADFYRRTQKLKLTGPGRDQLRRAAYSIGLNLAEGRGSRSRRQQRKFFDIALGSLRECQAVLVIEGLESTDLGKKADQLGAALYSLIRSML